MALRLNKLFAFNGFNFDQLFSWSCLIPQQMEINGIELLPIDIDHVAMVSELPFHHRDPFDRLLIAQAMFEQIPVVGADSVFDACSVKRLW